MENKIEREVNPLTRLAMRARKKFCKQTKEKVSPKPAAEYVFLKSNRVDEIEELKNRVSKMIKDNPNIQNPIAKLVDKTRYEKMDIFGKERYITKLANLYEDIVSELAI